MFITAALISLAALTATGSSAAPPDQSPPYTLSGVRQAAAAAEMPAEEREVQPSDEPPTGASRPPSGTGKRQRLNVGAWVPQPEIELPRDDRLVTPSLARPGPAWHRQFLAMTVPAYASSPFELMGTRERVEAVASNVVFGVALDGITRLVHDIRNDHRARKLAKLRRQVDEETAIVAAKYRATRRSE